MTDLPNEIMVWRSMEKLTHIGTWATERYPEEAVAYVPLAYAQAAQAMVVERAAKDARDVFSDDKTAKDAVDYMEQLIYSANRSRASASGVETLTKLRARAEKAEQERAAEWNRRRDADGSRDAARAACDTLRIERDRLAAANAVLEARVAGPGNQTFYIDCEFDGHNGPLLSIAVVREDGWSLHVSTGAVAQDPWVIANVLPIMDSHNADVAKTVRPNEVGTELRDFIGHRSNPVIVADSPVDIGRFCRAISTGDDGEWSSSLHPGMTFIVRNVDCYPTPLPGAVQHNAWWDAMALRAALATQEAGTC